MKKTVSLMLAAFTAALLLCSCSKEGSDKPASELLSAAADCGAYFCEMVTVDGSDIRYTYDLEESWYDDFAASVAGNMAFADEIVFVKASSDEDAAKIKKALEARVQSRKDTLQSYAPAEYDKLCSTEVKTSGNLVYLVVGADSKKAVKAAEDAF